MARVELKWRLARFPRLISLDLSGVNLSRDVERPTTVQDLIFPFAKTSLTSLTAVGAGVAGEFDLEKTTIVVGTEVRRAASLPLYASMTSLVLAGNRITRVVDGRGRDLPHVINGTLMRIDLPTPLGSGDATTFTIDWHYRLVEENAVGASPLLYLI